MIKTLLLIIEPATTWEGISRARRSVPFVLVAFLLPLLLLASVGEGYGLVNWGKWQDFGRLKKFSAAEALVVQTAQIVLSLVVVLMGAYFLKLVGETFCGRHSYAQAFATVAYSLSPLFLLRLLDAFRGISPWVSWAIGILLSIGVLYHGLPRMMETDPAHAFGQFFMSALLLVLVTGLVRFATAAYLQGKFTKVQVIVSDLAAQLPF
ncbi:MAG TPA: YIP1 family protein [Candidatus Paceibacterota bacterium]|nr:YIP1 family protein [Verrucomicrobiota bacterium]HSA10161.1 YIP1 family protein [Candidatus Paceibacterota bacterium]